MSLLWLLVAGVSVLCWCVFAEICCCVTVSGCVSMLVMFDVVCGLFF